MRAPVLFRHVGKTLVIVPALYLTLLHYPCGRLFALVALRRNQGSLLAKAMGGDQESLRQLALRRRSGSAGRSIGKELREGDLSTPDAQDDAASVVNHTVGQLTCGAIT